MPTKNEAAAIACGLLIDALDRFQRGVVGDMRATARAVELLDGWRAEYESRIEGGEIEGGEQMVADVLRLVSDALQSRRSLDALIALLGAAQAAYHHLDTYGVVTGGTEREMESQRRVFDLLRPAIATAEALTKIVI